jgi:hypothetical protein
MITHPCANDRCIQATPPDLLPGLRRGFLCSQLCAAVTDTMVQLVEHERLAWGAHCNGVHAYHERGGANIIEI